MFLFFYRQGYIPGYIHGDRVICYLGIIDVLQNYNLKKKLEHGIKTMIADRVGQIDVDVTVFILLFNSIVYIVCTKPNLLCSKISGFYGQRSFSRRS